MKAAPNLYYNREILIYQLMKSMLNQLTINNYAIVDNLNLELKSGMSVITGETGAGKSIMLDALGLALGDRADKEVIRSGAKRADISACFSVKGNKLAESWILENDFDSEGESECILRRVLTKEGRSKAYINGQPTSLSELKELGEMLIDIHNQHEHQSLLKVSTHQRLLDEFCGISLRTVKVADITRQWRQLKQSLEEIQSHTEEDNAQFQLISYQVKELDELALSPGELEQLEIEHSQLSNAEASLATNLQALEICRDNDQHNIQHSLNMTLSLLQSAPHPDEHIEEASDLLSTALIQVEEASNALSQSIDKFDLNPARLEEVDRRMSDIHQMARKHRINPKELVEHHLELKQTLEGMSQSDVKIESLQNELDELFNDYHKAAQTLSTERTKGALKLEQSINGHLTGLGMANAKFKLALNSDKSSPPSNRGYEQIEFLISTNPGQEPRALIKIASGGELSRISLAIQVATAQTSSIPSLVFDEVDVGIGGSVAKAVGELLRQLGNNGQVICVTHQPQVACQGHQHLFVSKKTGQDTTASQIHELDKKARIEEVARMLGGDEITENSLAHAEEMMA